MRSAERCVARRAALAAITELRLAIERDAGDGQLRDAIRLNNLAGVTQRLVREYARAVQFDRAGRRERRSRP
jgi:hypothetical protein